MRHAVSIRVKGDFRTVTRALQKHPKEAAFAASRALNRTISTIRKESTSETAKAMRVKSRLIRRRHATFQATPKSLAAGAYFHAQPIPVHSLAYPKEATALKRGGVRAGKHTFKKSFKGVYRRGKRLGKPSVFEYSAGSKTRVVRSMMPIPAKYKRVLLKVGGRVFRARFNDLFQKDLQYRLRKNAGSL